MNSSEGGEARIGEILLNIPKSSGGDHGNQYTVGKNRDESNFGKSKSETISEMGYSKDQVSDYQRMAHNQILDKYTKLYENNLSIMFNLPINIQFAF